LYDDGSHGDAVAGDLTFSLQATVAAGTAPGVQSLAVAVADAQGRTAETTIGLSVIARATIAQIQGDGLGSPLPAGTHVVTEGIVTARRANGYFIQSAEGEDDGDPATAEGVFVFTNTTPPATAAVGNRVRVTGRISLFSRTPHGYPLTQLGNSTLAVLASGESLPAAVALDETVLSPGVGTGALGRYQGMRVQLPATRVVGPTNAFGDFHVTLATVARPVREPGIAALDVVPLPAGHTIPRFDRNPERLRVESTGLAGGTPLFVDAGTQIAAMDGILYYDRGDFTLLIGDHSGLATSGGAYIAPVPAADEGAVRIGSYNIENLSGGESVPLTRLAKLTEVFCQFLRNPDVVGLVEIANLETAQRLARAINDNEFDTCPQNPMYEAHLLSTSGSQRLGFLVKTAPTAGGVPRVEVVDVAEQFVGEALLNPLGAADGVLFDRAPLRLDVRVAGENGEAFPVTVLLNHTLSLLDVVDLTPRAVWGTNGDRSRGKRLQQAQHVSELVEAIQSADPAQPLVLIGDYNAFDFSDGYVDVMGIIGGTPAAADQVLVHGASAVTRPLVNLIGTKPEAQRYSYVFEGNTQTLDHALVSQSVLASTEATLYHARVNSDFAADNAADPTVPVRTSDHDPLVADLVVPAFLDADLAVDVQATSKPVQDGQVVPFLLSVRNHGVARAIRTELTLRITASPAQVMGVTAPGWECAAAVADGSGSQVFCGRVDAMPAGAVDALRVDVMAWRTAPIQTLRLDAAAATRSVDTRAANDADAAAVKVTGKPRWTHGG
jgi:predicted extracellular nuclease